MIKYLLLTVIYTISSCAYALGMQPETTVLVINEEDGEASISVKNTDNVPSLLQTKIIDIDNSSSKEVVILASPTIVKVESGEEQIIRFFLQKKGGIKDQVLKRVKFLGLPARMEKNAEISSVNISVSQSIPLIINPKGLESVAEPWKFLKYTFENGKVYIFNPSRYVVRMYPYAKLDGNKVNLQHPFIAPRQKIEVDYKSRPKVMKIKPVGLYGEVRNEYEIYESKS
ncbi:fimbria/pilus chaperone family protein [Escherichia coli]|uniref:fimbria/pilus chaperone family protein n=1 Tax=Escherichia coli TaxID=562 RepID=UPI0029C65A27|nr:fimbria/pilus chaperone family protein [Escherichia coli]WOR72032.1 fimbria/pilus chaperone family protein [Escherichia coli]HCL7979513.1 fimbria/pilus periplasmic chaperone [Escherichia coli]